MKKLTEFEKVLQEEIRKAEATVSALQSEHDRLSALPKFDKQIRTDIMNLWTDLGPSKSHLASLKRILEAYEKNAGGK